MHQGCTRYTASASFALRLSRPPFTASSPLNNAAAARGRVRYMLSCRGLAILFSQNASAERAASAAKKPGSAARGRTGFTAAPSSKNSGAKNSPPRV